MSSDLIWAPEGDPLLPVCPRQRFAGFPNDPVQRGASYMPLSTILTTRFETDAHYGGYWHPEAPPRINNDGLSLLPFSPVMMMFIADVDCEKSHRATGGSESVPAPDEWFQVELDKILALDAAHPGVKWDRSRGGYRLAWRLENQLAVPDESGMTAWSVAYVRWLTYLARTFGIICDPACKNWNRIFRVPHATRKGNSGPDEYDSGGNALQVGLWTYDEDEVPLAIDIATARQVSAKYGDWNGHAVALLERSDVTKNTTNSLKTRTRTPPSPALTAAAASAKPNEIANSLVAPVLAVPDGWHYLFLAIAGALCERGVEGDRVLEIIEALSRSAGDSRTDDRVAGARTTVKRFASGNTTSGFGTLRRTWPEVAAALDQRLPLPEDEGIQRLRRELAERPIPIALSAHDAGVRIEATFKDAWAKPEPIYVISASTGAGKTTAALNALASTPSRAAIVFPNNALAKDAFSALSVVRRGEVQRRFGVLSVVDAKGDPVCKVAETAHQVQAAGLAVPSAVCARCSHKESCPAYGGAEGAEQPKVIVANHSLLRTTLDEVGARGMLVIDETPGLFEEARLTVEDLQTTVQQLFIGTFDDGYANRVLPFVFVFKQALEIMRRDELQDLNEALRLGALDAVELEQFSMLWLPIAVQGIPTCERLEPLEAALEAFRAAIGEREPPLSPRARTDLANGTHVAAIGRAAKILRLLAKAFGPGGSHVAGTEDPRRKCAPDRKRSDVLLTVPSEHVVAAMKRNAPTVILDGTADIAAISALASPRPVLEVNIVVADGAPVWRTVLYWRGGARSLMAPHGRPAPDVFHAPLREAMQRLALQQAKSVLVITHKPVADMLRRSVRIPSSSPKLLVDALAPLTAMGARVVIGHFGNVRGSNVFEGVGWNDLDAVVTLGDPWPDLGKAESEARLLGLDEVQARERLRALASIELAQAHGRLRAPMRSRPATAIHLGQLLPFGWNNQNARVEARATGRPPTQASMPATELVQLTGLAGGVRPLARAAGIPESTLRTYVAGRAIPAAVATQLRASAGLFGAPVVQRGPGIARAASELPTADLQASR